MYTNISTPALLPVLPDFTLKTLFLLIMKYLQK